MTKLCQGCNTEKSPSDFYAGWGRCKSCIKSDRALYYKRNKKAVIERVLAWRARNPDLVRKYADISYQRNYQREKLKWKAKKDKRRVAIRLEDLRRQKKYPEKYAAITARRRATKLQATPPWANEFFISEAYDLAKRRTVATGFPWHVDHIVPLKSPLVCGLHVERNLQVIPAIQNCKKNNWHWPDMP